MKNRNALAKLPLAALILACAIPPTVASQMEIRIDPDLQAKLKGFEARLEALRQEQRIAGLSVAIVKDHEIIYLKGLGSAGDGRPATPDTAYPVPSLKRHPGQPPWTVRDLARLDVVLDRGGVPEKKPYLAWHIEESGGTRLQWFAERGKGASALYLKVPEKRLTLILLANGDLEGDLLKSPFTQSFLKTFP
jgi:CubicO group peptidase (beta-lactamase class C family)